MSYMSSNKLRRSDIPCNVSGTDKLQDKKLAKVILSQYGKPSQINETSEQMIGSQSKIKTSEQNLNFF